MGLPRLSAPRTFHWALVACVVLGLQVALSAAFDVDTALRNDGPASIAEDASVPGSGLSPAAQRTVVLAGASGIKGAINGMGSWRVATSLLLGLSAGTVFLLAMRLRVSAEKRAAVALALGRAAMVTALLRSVDGAQSLVIARAATEEMGKALLQEGMVNAVENGSLMTNMISVASVAWTFVMVATFVGLGNYFRSENLLAALSRDE